MIPKIIVRTSKTYDEKIENLLMRNFQGWTHHYFNDQQCIDYIKNNKIKGIDNPYEKYIQYKDGAHRADFFRYYYLYINGGGFIDSDVSIHKNIDYLFLNKKFVSANSLQCPGHIFQGFLFVEKESPIIYEALKKMHDASEEEINFINGGTSEGYLRICKDMYNILKKYLPSDDICICEERKAFFYTSPNKKQNFYATKIGIDKDWFGTHWFDEDTAYNWDIKTKKEYEFSDNKQKIIKNLLKVYRTNGQEYIRVGSSGDGGYILVNDISKDDFIISCGIGDNVGWSTEDINFENELAPIVKGMDMYECAVDSLSNMPPNSRFFKAEIGNDTHIKDLFNNSGIQKDYILKMDIEGSEWDFLYNAKSSDIAKFRQIIIELHWLDNITTNNKLSKKILSSLYKINKTHKLVLIHGNNYSPLFNYGELVIPNVIEALYLRKDSYNFVDDNAESSDCPEKLNIDCAEQYPEINYFIG